MNKLFNFISDKKIAIIITIITISILYVSVTYMDAACATKQFRVENHIITVFLIPLPASPLRSGIRFFTTV